MIPLSIKPSIYDNDNRTTSIEDFENVLELRTLLFVDKSTTGEKLTSTPIDHPSSLSFYLAFF